MTINTRGGGVTHAHTHTHTHIPDKGQQCSLVLIQSRLVRWLVVCFIVRRVSVCALSIGCAPHACEYRLVGCAYAKKSVWLSLLYIHTHTIYTYTHTGRDSTAHKMVCAVLSLACVCVRVCCCCCCCGVRLRWGRNVVGIVSVVVVAAVAAAAAAADMIPRLFIHIVVVVW